MTMLLAMLAEQERASRAHPSRPVPGQPFGIHVTTVDGATWEAWLNTENEDFDGIVLATGPTREVVEAKAVEVLQAIMLAIVEPVKELSGGA